MHILFIGCRSALLCGGVFQPAGDGGDEPGGDGADVGREIFLSGAGGERLLHEHQLGDDQRDDGGGDGECRPGRQRHAGGGGASARGDDETDLASVQTGGDGGEGDAGGGGLHHGGDLCHGGYRQVPSVVFRRRLAGHDGRQRATGFRHHHGTGGRQSWRFQPVPGDPGRQYGVCFHHGGHRGESGL